MEIVLCKNVLFKGMEIPFDSLGRQSPFMSDPLHRLGGVSAARCYALILDVEHVMKPCCFPLGPPLSGQAFVLTVRCNGKDLGDRPQV